MRHIRLLSWVLLTLAQLAWATPGEWDQPAAALAGQIAEIMGPGQVRLTLDNLSSISGNDARAIQGLLEQDLKAHGITVSGAESANALRITLSENAHERLWVAEVVQGNQTQVTMVSLPAAQRQRTTGASGIALASEMVLTTDRPVLALLESGSGLVALEPEQVVYFVRDQIGWTVSARSSIVTRRALARDVRGTMQAENGGFTAWLPGEMCSGQTDSVGGAGSLLVQCTGSDDPWPIAGVANAATGGAQLKAFYNARRNYFTGVVTPNVGVDLPEFYAAALVPRAVGGAGLLIGGIDGKAEIVENNAPKQVSGTRDWGSDFVALNSGCGLGTQVIASSSGNGANDSLRAYELPALEAVPVSAPLAMGGPVMAMWAAAGNKSTYVTVKRSADDYEVERVTARCN